MGLWIRADDEDDIEAYESSVKFREPSLSLPSKACMLLATANTTISLIHFYQLSQFES